MNYDDLDRCPDGSLCKVVEKENRDSIAATVDRDGVIKFFSGVRWLIYFHPIEFLSLGEFIEMVKASDTYKEEITNRIEGACALPATMTTDDGLLCGFWVEDIRVLKGY